MKITKDNLRDLVMDVLKEMLDDEDVIQSEINSTGDIVGYDAPLGNNVKRKLSKPDDEKKDD